MLPGYGRLTLAMPLAAQGRLARFLRLRRPQACPLRCLLQHRLAGQRRPCQTRHPGQIRRPCTAGRLRSARGCRASRSSLLRTSGQRLGGCQRGRATCACISLGRARTLVCSRYNMHMQSGQSLKALAVVQMPTSLGRIEALVLSHHIKTVAWADVELLHVCGIADSDVKWMCAYT